MEPSLVPQMTAARLDHFARAWRDCDFDTLRGYLAADAVYSPLGGELVRGREAVVKRFAEVMADEGGSEIRFEPSAVSQTSQPDFLDPSLGYTVNAIEAFWLVYTPPLTYPRKEGDAGAQLIPGLAEEMPEISEDGLTYEFTFRKGLRYSDGTPLKASDFEHSIRRVLNLESGGSAFYLVIEGAQDFIDAGKCDGDIAGIETDDKSGRVTIRLTEPDGAFQHVLAMWFSAPVPGDTPCRNLTKEPPPGIGPYVFTESVPNRQFVMENRT
jgi:peptide/nickel transport system substrate-binding protein